MANAATKQGWERVEELRETAARRGKIDHAEGARYETPGWGDVLILIAEIDELRAALHHKDEAADEVNRTSSAAKKLLSEELIEERREEQRRENEQDAAQTHPSAEQLLTAIEALLHWRVLATNENQGGLWFYDPEGMGTMPLGPVGIMSMYEKEAKARGWL